MYVGVGLVKTPHREPQFQAWIGFPQQTNLDPAGALLQRAPSENASLLSKTPSSIFTLVGVCLVK